MGAEERNGTPQRRITITFTPEGEPAIQFENVTPTQIAVAADWLKVAGEIGITQRLMQDLQGQGPRIVPAAVKLRPVT